MQIFPYLQFVPLKVTKYISILFILFFLCYELLNAKPHTLLLKYKEGKQIVINLLNSNFPIPDNQEYKKQDNKKWEIIELPPEKRILKKILNNQIVYYYRYKIKIPIYRRKDLTIIDYRIEDIWLRIQEREQKVSLSFLREDLLPGNFPVYIQ